MFAIRPRLISGFSISDRGKNKLLIVSGERLIISLNSQNCRQFLLWAFATDVAHSMFCMCVWWAHTSEPYKNGWTNQDVFEVAESYGPKKACIRWGFTWQIWLIAPCVAAMLPFVKLLLTTCWICQWTLVLTERSCYYKGDATSASCLQARQTTAANSRAFPAWARQPSHVREKSQRAVSAWGVCI